MCEINIISLYYNKNKEDTKIIEKINDKITKILNIKLTLKLIK